MMRLDPVDPISTNRVRTRRLSRRGWPGGCAGDRIGAAIGASSRRGAPLTLLGLWLALALCLPWLPPPAMAQTLSQTELQKLPGPNASADAEFGISVAISGDRALIGAQGGVDDAGARSGAAYVYERDATGTWVEVAELTPSDAKKLDRSYFGVSVALSGDLALVGAYQDDISPDGPDQGAAYVFERGATGTWVEVAKLIAADASDDDNFGASVALSDDRALIGAPRHGSPAFSGAAYVYERDATGAWVQVDKLGNTDAATYRNFGSAVALSGDRALIGGRGKNGTNIGSGAAYVYERDATGTWVEVAELTALGAGSFGFAVQLSGDRALIGAEHSNAAYVFERDGAGMWVQVVKLTASDGNGQLDHFGDSVALSGNRVLIGAGSADVAGPASGAAYVFERDAGGTWTEVTKLMASDGAPGDRFGGSNDSVALLGDTALIGSAGARLGDAVSGSGAVYVFNVAAENDADEDGIVDAMDNCPADYNPRQENFDGDSLGDVCDPDDDNDGVDDTDDPFPLDPERTLPPLILDRVDPVEYGYLLEGTDRFDNLNRYREVLERQFDASGSNLSLTLNGYDIDRADEVRVRVNGVRIGFLSKTPDNGRATSRLTIGKHLLKSTGNTLRFEQTRPRWRWGVSDLLLSEIDALPPLVLGELDSGKYGHRFEGASSHREILERRFEASGTDLVLTLTGYDIDIAKEVRVLVNGKRIGFLSRTPDNERGTSQLTIASDLLRGSGNTLRLRQTNPGWIWGVTDLLLERRR